MGTIGAAGATGPPVGGTRTFVGAGTIGEVVGGATPLPVPGAGAIGRDGEVEVNGKLDGGLIGSWDTVGGGKVPAGNGNAIGEADGIGAETGDCAIIRSRLGGGNVPLTGITPLGCWLLCAYPAGGGSIPPAGCTPVPGWLGT